MVTGKWPAKDESSRKQCSVHRCDDYLRAMTLTSLNPDFDDWPISSSFFFFETRVHFLFSLRSLYFELV
jgi:hypothetical protein